MQIIRQLDPLRDVLAEYRQQPCKIGLVPTMGALHAGHMRLVEVAIEQCDIVVASVFVNPAQFAEGEDLDTYPRQEAIDFALLKDAGVQLIWAPDADQMYAADYSTRVIVEDVGDGLCTITRPHFFEGVATVVTKLFNQILPDVAYFGEKDFQQLAVIKRLTRDLDFTHEVISVPTVRDADGLALSSRNAYLSPEQRLQAVALPNIMRDAANAIIAGGDVVTILEDSRSKLLASGFDDVDYFELRDPDSLATLNEFTSSARLLAAGHVGKTRLIDNIAVTRG